MQIPRRIKPIVVIEGVRMVEGLGFAGASNAARRIIHHRVLCDVPPLNAVADVPIPFLANALPLIPWRAAAHSVASIHNSCLWIYPRIYTSPRIEVWFPPFVDTIGTMGSHLAMWHSPKPAMAMPRQQAKLKMPNRRDGPINAIHLLRKASFQSLSSPSPPVIFPEDVYYNTPELVLPPTRVVDGRRPSRWPINGKGQNMRRQAQDRGALSVGRV